MHRVTLLFLVAGIAGCPGLGQVAFDVNSQGQSTVPGAGPAGGVLNVFPSFGNFNFSQNQTFQNNNTDKSHVDSAHLSKLTLKVVSPASANLGFLNTVEFDISAPNLPTVRIAEASIPANVASVDLSLDAVDIGPYVKADSFSLTTKATGHQPSSDTTLEADLTIHVVANVL